MELTPIPQSIIRDIQPEDYIPLIELGRSELNVNWTSEFLSWKYDHNPAGKAFCSCVEVENHPLGYYGNIPVKIRSGDQKYIAAQAVDAVVSPKIRRQGLFVKLAQSTYARMDQADIVLTYAFPNTISKAGFVNRLSWTPVGQIPRYVKILDLKLTRGVKHTVYYLIIETILSLTTHSNRGFKDDVQIRQVNVFDERVDLLWEKVIKNLNIAVERNSKYLNWRYTYNPLRNYLILLAERGKQLLGLCVLSLNDFRGARVAAVLEFLVLPDELQAGNALLSGASNYAKEHGCWQLQCWMLPQHKFYTNMFRNNGFVFSTNRLLPRDLRHTTSFIIRTKPGNIASQDALQLQNWFITMGDHDYY